MNKQTKIILTVLFLPFQIIAQQIADTTYQPVVKNPKYKQGTGALVFIDEGHHNFHTKEGRYKPFANLLERDGYIVKEYTGEFTAEKLIGVKILVIANALNEVNETRWIVPILPAFTKDEVGVVKKWVNDGGSLFLIADHMPMAGAAKDLAAAFGFEFTNGFALDTISSSASNFYITDGTLEESEITNGRDTIESVEHVATFTGQAFKIPGDATPVLIFNDKHINLMPDTAWAFRDSTPKQNVQGWSQGAFKKSGKGKIVVFGEAAMFTAQLAGPQRKKVGMNSNDAPENYQLLLNIVHWLDRHD